MRDRLGFPVGSPVSYDEWCASEHGSSEVWEATKEYLAGLGEGDNDNYASLCWMSAQRGVLERRHVGDALSAHADAEKALKTLNHSSSSSLRKHDRKAGLMHPIERVSKAFTLRNQGIGYVKGCVSFAALGATGFPEKAVFWLSVNVLEARLPSTLEHAATFADAGVIRELLELADRQKRGGEDESVNTALQSPQHPTPVRVGHTDSQVFFENYPVQNTVPQQMATITDLNAVLNSPTNPSEDVVEEVEVHVDPEGGGGGGGGGGDSIGPQPAASSGESLCSYFEANPSLWHLLLLPLYRSFLSESPLPPEVILTVWRFVLETAEKLPDLESENAEDQTKAEIVFVWFLVSLLLYFEDELLDENSTQDLSEEEDESPQPSTPPTPKPAEPTTTTTNLRDITLHDIKEVSYAYDGASEFSSPSPRGQQLPAGWDDDDGNGGLDLPLGSSWEEEDALLSPRLSPRNGSQREVAGVVPRCGLLGRANAVFRKKLLEKGHLAQVFAMTEKFALNASLCSLQSVVDRRHKHLVATEKTFTVEKELFTCSTNPTPQITDEVFFKNIVPFFADHVRTTLSEQPGVDPEVNLSDFLSFMQSLGVDTVETDMAEVHKVVGGGHIDLLLALILFRMRGGIQCRVEAVLRLCVQREDVLIDDESFRRVIGSPAWQSGGTSAAVTMSTFYQLAVTRRGVARISPAQLREILYCNLSSCIALAPSASSTPAPKWTDSEVFHPIWVDDSSYSNCFVCKRTFRWYRRRHHCRSCGQLICGGCSLRRMRVVGWNSLVRVCTECGESLHDEGTVLGFSPAQMATERDLSLPSSAS